MVEEIETERFFLKRFDLKYIDDLYELDSNPIVHKYIGTKALTNKDQAKEIINKLIAQYEKYGIGRLAIISKENEEFIGWCGLKYETMPIHNENGYYDLGYRLIPRYWGKGIATETSSATLKFGLEKFRLNRICAAADVGNIASNKVLQKIGMNYIENFVFEGISCNWYEINNNK